MTYDDITKLALARVDEDSTDIDINAMTVIENAVNQAYMTIRTMLDRRTKVATITATNLIALPIDFVEATRVVHSKDGEYSKQEYYQDGDQMYFYPKMSTGNITLTYIFFPVTLSITADVIAVKDGYIYGLVAYGAYAYQLYRKKYSAAQLLLAEYQSMLMPEKQKPKN